MDGREVHHDWVACDGLEYGVGVNMGLGYGISDNMQEQNTHKPTPPSQQGE